MEKVLFYLACTFLKADDERDRHANLLLTNQLFATNETKNQGY